VLLEEEPKKEPSGRKVSLETFRSNANVVRALSLPVPPGGGTDPRHPPILRARRVPRRQPLPTSLANCEILPLGFQQSLLFRSIPLEVESQSPLQNSDCGLTRGTPRHNLENYPRVHQLCSTILNFVCTEPSPHSTHPYRSLDCNRPNRADEGISFESPSRDFQCQ
jgi:hypothetical protein